MPGNSAVKSTARAALKSFWPQAVACCFVLLAGLFIPFCVCEVGSTVFGVYSALPNALFSALFGFAVILPLFFGVLRYFRRAIYGNTDSTATVFYYFSSKRRYFDMLFFSVMLAVHMLGFAAVTFLPYIVIRIMDHMPMSILPDSFLIQSEFVGGLFFLLGFAFFILATVKYYAAPMIFISCDDIHWTEAFYMSKQLSRYSAGSFLVLIVGFVGWVLLSFSGIALIFTLPYMLAAYVVHCRYAFNFYNHKIQIMQETDFPEYRSTF